TGPRPAARVPLRQPLGSDLQELFLLVAEDLLHLGDELVGELLQFLLGTAQVIFGDGVVMLKSLQLLLRVAADVPHGDAALLRTLPDDLDEVPAALLGERRER